MSMIIAVRKNKGKIIDCKLDDGRELSHSDIVDAINRGKIAGCIVVTTDDGEEMIKSNNSIPGFSLSSLPLF